LTFTQLETYAAAMRRRIVLHGHRGARGLFPENTLVGAAGALAIGVDALELDVAMTVDDVVIVTHDPRLNPDITRTRDGEWLVHPGPPIRSLRAADLADYDVGRLRPDSAYATLFPDQAPSDGATIPALADLLDIDQCVVFNIELKTFPSHPGLSAEGDAMADAVAAVADAHGVTNRLIVQSFDWRGLRRLRCTRSDIHLSWLTSSALLAGARTWWDGPHPSDFGGSVPRAIAAEGGPTWGPDYGDLTAESLVEAHRLGLKVVPWTVNQPEHMRRLIRWGVDGLITDRPDLARGVLADEGFSVPPSGWIANLGPP
jgi:glycerophosphoryl diester phosphodiesterase